MITGIRREKRERRHEMFLLALVNFNGAPFTIDQVYVPGLSRKAKWTIAQMMRREGDVIELGKEPRQGGAMRYRTITGDYFPDA